MDPPDGEHVLGVAAAHVDDVLVQQVAFDVVDGPDEEREVARFGASGERGVEVGDVARGITARCAQKTGVRPLPTTRGASEIEGEVVEKRIVRLHREAAAAHGNDEAVGHRLTTRKPMCLSP